MAPLRRKGKDGEEVLRGLEKRRKAIEAVDLEILRLLCRRMELVRSVGRLKSLHRIPLRNFEVEAEVERRLGREAADAGHGEALGRALARFLIGVSVEAQAPYLDATYGGEKLRVLVVGGAGGMGRWMGRFLNGQGHAVKVHDPSPLPTPHPRVSNLAEGLEWADLALLAVPMGVCGEVLKAVSALRFPGIVAEICSFKAHLLPVLEEVRRRGLRVVSFHPMFGPGAETLSGKKVLFCREGAPQDVALLRGLFENTSAELGEVDLLEHDRLMAKVLGLVHLANLALGWTLARGGLPWERLREAGGVTFRKQTDTTREVIFENPDLYFEIQRLNPERDGGAAALVESLEEILGAVRSGNREAFSRLMEAGRRYFGPAP